jgi:hypothetical protein
MTLNPTSFHHQVPDTGRLIHDSIESIEIRMPNFNDRQTRQHYCNRKH